MRPKTKKSSVKWILVAPLIIIVLAGLLYYFRGQFVVAIVNGKPICRWTLIKELEKQAGKRTLESLITKTLILQEAKKQKVAVSDDEVNQEIKQIEENFTSQGQDFNQLLEIQGITRNGLMEEIRLQKMVETIAGKDVEVTDKEIDDYIKENKDNIPQDMKEEEIRATAKEQLKQQKMNEKIQSWIKSLRDGAKIKYF